MLGIGVLAAALLASGVVPAAAGPQPLSKIRVCGNNRVPFTGSECPRDESRTAIVANELDCSVRVHVERAAKLLEQIRYLGQVQYQYTSRVRRGTSNRVIGTYFFNTKMPAGRYSCRFTLGRRSVGASFRSGGPAGTLLGPSVCLATHRVGNNECPRDEGGAPLPATNRITCDAVFARERGRTATIELLDSAGNAVATQQDSLDFPITEAGASFTSDGPSFSPGAYNCAFAVAGAHAVRRFTVSG